MEAKLYPIEDPSYGGSYQNIYKIHHVYTNSNKKSKNGPPLTVNAEFARLIFAILDFYELQIVDAIWITSLNTQCLCNPTKLLCLYLLFYHFDYFIILRLSDFWSLAGLWMMWAAFNGCWQPLVDWPLCHDLICFFTIFLTPR